MCSHTKFAQNPRQLRMHINLFPSVVDASHLMSKHIPVASNFHKACQTMFGFSIYPQLFSDYSESVPFSKTVISTIISFLDHNAIFANVSYQSVLFFPKFRIHFFANLADRQGNVCMQNLHSNMAYTQLTDTIYFKLNQRINSFQTKSGQK